MKHASAAPAKSRRRLLAGLATAYPLVLLALTLTLRFVGERHWLTAILLYVPRVAFALPLLVLVPWLVHARAWRLLALQGAAAVLVVVPLMGLVCSSGRPQAAVSPTARARVRLLSFNADMCAGGFDTLVERVIEQSPDVALLQEVCENADYVVERLRAHFPVARLDREFLLASRLPLASVDVGAAVEGSGHAPYVRYVLRASTGPLAFYSVHPVSPRPAFLALRAQAWADWRRGTGMAALRANFARRAQELDSALRRARGEQVPVVIAGDTNLPSLSPLLAQTFDGFTDAFAATGWGFGYTFPRGMPWLRLDRIYADASLVPIDFRTLCVSGLDHCAVLATLEATR